MRDLNDLYWNSIEVAMKQRSLTIFNPATTQSARLNRHNFRILFHLLGSSTRSTTKPLFEPVWMRFAKQFSICLVPTTDLVALNLARMVHRRRYGKRDQRSRVHVVAAQFSVDRLQQHLRARLLKSTKY